MRSRGLKKQREEDIVEQVSASEIPSSSTHLLGQPQADGEPKVPSDLVKLIAYSETIKKLEFIVCNYTILNYT